MSLERLPLDSAENELVLADTTFRAATTTADFTTQYDQAVDLLEDYWMGSALRALSVFDIDEARANLAEARLVRSRYIELLELSAQQENHPLAERLSSLQEYASFMAELRDNLDSVLRAWTEYRQGNSKAALGILNSLNPSHSKVLENDVESVLACNLATMSESLAGEIRLGSLDHVGACASFYGAVSSAENGLKVISSLVDEDNVEEDNTALLTSSFEMMKNQNSARALQMEYQMALQQGDLRGAIDAAHSAAESWTKAAEFADFVPLLPPLFLAYSCESSAGEYEAQASLALEAGQWDEAAEFSREVSKQYLAASEACIQCSHELGGFLQLRYLNTRVNWNARFGRQLSRERDLQSKLADAEAKFDSLFQSVRGALVPAGVVVKNETEIHNVVQQQVEITNRIETNIRNMLRDVPNLLADLDLPPEDKAQLSEEALHLADDSEVGPTFFERVKKFAVRLADVTSKVATVAGPILAIAQALAVIV
jgi:hypothetical protein